MTKSLPAKSLVLYADDDPDDLDLVKEAFRQYSRSIQLVCFTDGIQLLDYLSDAAAPGALPCLIILDINMPQMDGKRVLSKLRSMQGFEDVPVVLFSTSTLPSEQAFATSFNAGFITKPLNEDQMYQLVDKMVEHCQNDVKATIRKGKGK
jgi:CheY-like chemotaxis protein